MRDPLFVDDALSRARARVERHGRCRSEASSQFVRLGALAERPYYSLVYLCGKVFAVSTLRGDFLRLDAELRRVAAHPVCPPRAHGADFLRIPRSYFPGHFYCLLRSDLRLISRRKPSVRA